MDFYTFSLLLGGAGLVAMAASGFARHSGVSHSGVHGTAPAFGHVWHVGGLHTVHSHAHAHSVASHAVPHGSSHGAGGSSGFSAALSAGFGALVSPRVLFGILLGLGTAGVLLAPLLHGGLQFAAALVLALMFDRLLLTPLWNLSLRFASRPALTLETAVTSDATAITAFDAEGHGIVQIELDGQLVQLLGTLTPEDRALGHRVRAGERLRVEDVDAARNRCHVTLL
jgi:hypothetical protein